MIKLLQRPLEWAYVPVAEFYRGTACEVSIESWMRLSARLSHESGEGSWWFRKRF
jgi:hypothetical protein